MLLCKVLATPQPPASAQEGSGCGGVHGSSSPSVPRATPRAWLCKERVSVCLPRVPRVAEIQSGSSPSTGQTLLWGPLLECLLFQTGECCSFLPDPVCSPASVCRFHLGLRCIVLVAMPRLGTDVFLNSRDGTFSYVTHEDICSCFSGKCVARVRVRRDSGPRAPRSWPAQALPALCSQRSHLCSCHGSRHHRFAGSRLGGAAQSRAHGRELEREQGAHHSVPLWRVSALRRVGESRCIPDPGPHPHSPE